MSLAFHCGQEFNHLTPIAASLIEPIWRPSMILRCGSGLSGTVNLLGYSEVLWDRR